ncbi:MAG: DUF1846 family protein [Candidatus ainarchaeum sp.]|nr:DUF1846 family protein [Candidatus ainarchaeum sp.]
MKAFDNNKYLELTKKEIKKRAKKFNKIYIEIGGHVIKDYHAKRVLIDYKEDNKIRILENIKKEIEIIYCIYSKHLNPIKKDYNSKKEYPKIILKELEYLKKRFKIAGVMITRCEDEKYALDFKKKLENKNYKVYISRKIKEYPNNIKIILGKNGYLKNEYIKTSKKIIIVTSAVANSGKMSTCLSQIYHDSKQKINSGFLKLETFPIWNLDINHPINIAYEAATADIGDKNQIDPYYLKKHKKKVVNYNRDIENFKILQKIISKITSKKNKMNKYFSPTEMGINEIKKAIINENKIKKASINEIKNRQKKYLKEYKNDKKTIKRINEIIMKIKKLY